MIGTNRLRNLPTYFARHFARRLTAEEAYDAITRATNQHRFTRELRMGVPVPSLLLLALGVLAFVAFNGIIGPMIFSLLATEVPSERRSTTLNLVYLPLYAAGINGPATGALTTSIAGVSGPFTLAAILRGYENYVMDMITDPDYARRLMDFTYQVGLTFGTAFVKTGAGLSINESWITPPMLSPEMFRDFPFRYERALIADLKKAGFSSIGLISGGNTWPRAVLRMRPTTTTSSGAGGDGCGGSVFRTI